MANLAVMSFSAWSFWKSANAAISPAVDMEQFLVAPNNSKASGGESDAGSSAETLQSSKIQDRSLVKAQVGSTDSAGFYFVTPREGERVSCGMMPLHLSSINNILFRLILFQSFFTSCTKGLLRTWKIDRDRQGDSTSVSPPLSER